MITFSAKPKVVRKFKIPSMSEDGLFYSVEIWNDKEITCDCPDFLYHLKRKFCKHTRKVIKYLEKEKYKKYV